MAANDEILGISARFDVSDIEKGYSVIDNTLKKTGQDVYEVNNIFKRAAQGAVAFFSIQQAQAFAKQIALVRGEFQQLEVAFKTMLGSEKEATALMNQLVTTAAKTPFDLQGVASGAKQLLAFGIASDKVNETIVRLGDIAAGLSIPLGDLVYLYGTTMTQGRLFTQDLRQFMGRGIPLADELAKQFGVTKDAVGDLVTAGKVGFPEVEKAIVAMTSKGGKFGGLMEEQSKTISGQISNIEDAFASMLNDIGKSNEGIINEVLGAASSLVENYETIGKVIGTVIGVYGTYKAALIVQAGVTKALTVVEQQAAVTKALLGHHANTLTAAQYRQIAVTKLLQSAQRSLIATMKGAGTALMNPYVLATAAVVGLGVAIYKAATAESAMERGVKAANAELEKQEKLLEERKNNIQSLINTIQDENATELQQLEAYEKLSKLAPQITNAYSQQQIATMETADAQKNLNAAMDSARYVQLKDNIIIATNEIQKYKKYIEQASYNPQGNANVMAYQERIKVLQEQVKEYTKQLEDFERKQKEVAENNRPIELRIADKDRMVFEAEEQLKEAESILVEERKKIENNPFYQIPVILILDVEAKRKALEEARAAADELRASADAETYQEAKKKAMDAYNKAVKERKEAEGKSKAAWTKANKDVEKAESELKTLGINPDTYKKKQIQQAKSNAAYKDFLKQQEDDKKQTQIDLELNTRESLLSTEKETNEKRKKQIELDYDKRIAEIKKQEKKFKDAKIEEAKKEFEKNPANKDKIFDSSSVDTSLTTEEKANIDAKITAAEANKAKALDNIRKEELQSMRDYLMEYGTLEQQRLAIAEEYAEKIAKAQTEGEKASLRVQQAQAEKNIQQKAFDKSFDWSAIFQDLQGHTVEYLTSLRDQLQDVLKNGGLDPEQMAIAQEKLRELNDEISRSGGIFDFVGSRQREQNRREQEAKDAKDALTAAQIEQGGLEMRLSQAKLLGAPTNKILALEKQLADAREKTAKATALAKEKEDGAKESAADALARWFGDAQEFIAKHGIDQIPELLNSVGLGSLGEKASMGMSAFNNAKGAAEDWANQNYIGAAIKGINAVKDFSNMLGIGGSSDKSLHADIERLTAVNESLQFAIEKLTDVMDETSTANATGVYEEQKKYLEESTENTRELMERAGRAHDDGFLGIGGSKSSNKKIDEAMSSSDWQRISKAVGRTIQSAGDFWKLTPEEMLAVARDLPDLYAKIKDYADNGAENAAQFMDDYIGYAEQLEELETAYLEKMTSVSFDSLRNSFKDALTDMASDAQDLSMALNDILTNAVAESIMTETIDPLVREYQELLAKYMKDGKLTETELDELSKLEAKINKEIENGREVLEAIENGDTFKDAESAAARGIENITQDQANALEGIMTAQQIALEQGNAQRLMIVEAAQLMQVDVSDIRLSASRMAIDVADIRDTQTRSLSALYAIRDNTSVLPAMAEDLSRMRKDINEMK